MEMLGSSGPLAGICKSSVLCVLFLGHVFFCGSSLPVKSMTTLHKRLWQLHKVERYLSINTFFCRTQLHLLQVTAAIQWFMLTVLCLEMALWFQEKQKSAPLMLPKVCLQLYFQFLNWIFLSNCFFCKYLNKFTVKALKSFNIKGVWPLQTVCMV